MTPEDQEALRKLFEERDTRDERCYSAVANSESGRLYSVEAATLAGITIRSASLALRRLEKAGRLVSEIVLAKISGPPRCYYRIKPP